MLAALLPGCLVKPEPPSGSQRGTELAPRLIASGYYEHNTEAHSPGMAQGAYSLPTAGVVDGDLLVVIGNINSGSSATITPPPGFQVIGNHTIGNYDQTSLAAWKLADHEPASYLESYGPSVSDGDAVFALIAIAGADPQNPVRHTSFDDGSPTAQLSPVVESAVGLDTAAAGSLLLWAGGADWQADAGNHVAQFAVPDGYEELISMGDLGNAHYAQTTLSVAFAGQRTTGPTGAVSGSTATDNMGIPWAMLYEIAPAQ